ncbi:MAG: transcriptional regulator [Aliarcobacter butzleri]|nr:MAG: transcriptional regulator [Aliarcobacter butzleri]
MREEQNIIKKTCKEIGLTYAQLAEEIGYSEPAIKKAIANDNISEPMKKAIELYLENLELKKELENSNKIKQTLKEWLK